MSVCDCAVPGVKPGAVWVASVEYFVNMDCLRGRGGLM